LDLQPAKSQPTLQPKVKPTTVRKAASQAGQQSTHALTSERVRERMVERLRANGITDARVLAAMAAVPRHMFVDPGLPRRPMKMLRCRSVIIRLSRSRRWSRG